MTNANGEKSGILQAAALKRCASCSRWCGNRRAAAPGFVEIESETSTGLCQDGPWNGQTRRARSACGHWIRWPALEIPTEIRGLFPELIDIKPEPPT